MEMHYITPDGKAVTLIDLTDADDGPQLKKPRNGPKPATRVFVLNLAGEDDAAKVPQEAPLPQPVPLDVAQPHSRDLCDAEVAAPEIQLIDPLEAKYPTRTYLNVPYLQKDYAKSYGAKWDSERRRWYVYKKNQHHFLLVQHFSLHD